MTRGVRIGAMPGWQFRVADAGKERSRLMVVYFTPQAWSSTMGMRLTIAALVFLMVQAVLFGIGTVLVLATPLSEFAMTLMPWVVGVSTVISLPLSWFVAPRLRLRYWREREHGHHQMWKA